MSRLPVLALTPGEPAGIGPDLALIQAGEACDCHLVLIADPDLLKQRAAQRGLAVNLATWTGTPAAEPRCYILPIALPTPAVAGRLDPANARYVLATLERAVQGCIQGEFDALVTGPVHKGVINDAGIPFSGHTEFLAQLTGTKQAVMMLMSGDLRVALVTTHLPLADVAKAITRELLTSTMVTLHAEMQAKLRIPQPRILVCGLNPHAGECGHLGREERAIIEPVVAELRSSGMDLRGPVPADTAFIPQQLAGTDAVLAMYHDQGLPALKARGFGNTVNVTLGLPLIRTSVDHGTALELAGRGAIDPGSLQAAVALAVHLVRP